jgi:hypothetical protein
MIPTGQRRARAAPRGSGALAIDREQPPATAISERADG